MSMPPSHMKLTRIGGKMYQPNAQASRIASQKRNARVGMLPAAELSARCGMRISGRKR